MIPSTSLPPPSKVLAARSTSGLSHPARVSPSISSSPGLQYHRQRRLGRVTVPSTLSSSVTRPTISSAGKQRPIIRTTSSTSLVSLSSALRQTAPPKSPLARKSETKAVTPSRPVPDMSVLYRQLAAALVAEAKVIFDQDGIVDLIGSANTGSSYSLPGHLTLTLPNLPPGHEGRLREVRDLQITVEGKSEFFDKTGRYTPLRLYTNTIILATPVKPLLIPSSNPMQTHSHTITVAIDFDLRLPGWLPPTHISTLTNTEYGVVVKSSIGWTEAAASVYGAPNISGKSIAFRSRSQGRPAALLAQLSHLVDKKTSAYHPFIVKRHQLPSAMNSRAINGARRSYIISPESQSTSPVECIVTLPNWLDCFGGERDFKIEIRFRARRGAIEDAVKKFKALPSTEAANDSDTATASGANIVPPLPATSGQTGMMRGTTAGGAVGITSHAKPVQCAIEQESEVLTQILELAMAVEEREEFSSIPIAGYTAVFPIPDAGQQPDRRSSHNAFISPRSPHADTRCTASDDVFMGHRTRKCLLADDGTQRTFRFNGNGLPMGERWRKVDVVIPMPRDGTEVKSQPQSSMEGPMIRIKHVLKIRVACKNVGTDELTVVVLTVPVQFGTSPATEELVRAGARVVRKPSLPAYIQTFHENGEQRRCDPLPLYTPTAHSVPPPLYYEIAHAIGAKIITTRPPRLTIDPPLRSTPMAPSLPFTGNLAFRSHWARPVSSSSTGSTSTSAYDDEASDWGQSASSDEGHGSVGTSRSSTNTTSSLFPPAIPASAITKSPSIPVATA